LHYGKNRYRRPIPKVEPTVIIEPLEDRRLLSHGGFGFGGFGFGGGGGRGGFGRGLSSVEFSQAPSKVQSGLDMLATADNLAAPTSTQTVYLGNQNGVETYTIDITGTGTQTALTVDQDGGPVTAPTNGTTTYMMVPSAVSMEASAIASALSLTVPATTASVRVSTPSGGTSVYTIELVASSTSTHTHGRVFEINASGDPVGSLNLPFSAIPSSLQTALNNNRPSTATALATTSTQSVKIRTNSGVTTYSTSFTVGSATTTVTVNTGGTLTSLPSHSTTTFSTLSTTVQDAINALAADNGATGTVAGTTTVQVYDEANGTTIYSVNVNGSKIGFSGNSFTYNLTISVDQDGNPTTLPSGGGGGLFGGSFGGFGGNAFFGGFGFFGRRHR
jgi:hypothetical protein